MSYPRLLRTFTFSLTLLWLAAGCKSEPPEEQPTELSSTEFLPTAKLPEHTAQDILAGEARKHLQHAEECLEAGQFEDAVKELTAAVRLNPQSARAHHLLGYAYFKSNRLPEAIDAYRISASRAPNEKEGHYSLCSALMAAKRFKEAASACAEALKLDGNYVPALVNLGLSLAEIGHAERAVEYLNRSIRLKPTAAAYERLGQIYNQQGQHEDAIGTLQQAIVLNGGRSVEARLQLGTAYKALGQLVPAERELKEVLRLSPRNARARVLLADLLLLKGQTTDAQQFVAEALSYDPDNTLLRYQHAVLLKKLQRSDEARQELERIIARDPKYALAHQRLGDLHIGSEEYEEAIAAYRQALAVGKGDAELYYNLGFAYRQTQRFAEAIAALKQTVQLAPDNHEAFYGLGNTYETIGDQAGALEAYRKAARLDPKNERYRAVLQRLRH